MRVSGVLARWSAVITAAVGLAVPAKAWDQPQWVRQLGARSVAEASAVATDDHGGIYVSGSGSLGDTSDDAWLAKYSASGTPVWKRRLGTAAVDTAAGVAADSKGTVYVAGSTQGALGGRFRGGFDAWIARYSADGNLVWKRQFGTTQLDITWSVTTDGKGNAYAAGWTSGSLGRPFQGGASDAWVARFSPAGALVWLRQLGTADTEQATTVSTDNAGNVFVAGSTERQDGGGQGDAFVAKYAADGKLMWQRRLGTPVFDIALGAAATADGGVYVCGNTAGAIATRNLGDFDAWIARYSSDGRLLWARQIGTAATDGAHAVASDADGNAYISGSTSGALASASRGFTDAWIARFSPAGDLDWKRQLGSPEDDDALGIAADRSGSVYVGGTTAGSLAGPHPGAIDAWVAKYSARR
ncbi:MAG: SBBP repeat-containing protein [Rhodospirillales bacterium]|nr:SBBP repeat-containing protein [Rhodospirillales bacterium]